MISEFIMNKEHFFLKTSMAGLSLCNLKTQVDTSVHLAEDTEKRKCVGKKLKLPL